jgi:hypothetical protein
MLESFRCASVPCGRRCFTGPKPIELGAYFGTKEGTPRRGGAVKSKHPHMSSDLSFGKASKPPRDGNPKLRRQNFTRLTCEWMLLDTYPRLA